MRKIQIACVVALFGLILATQGAMANSIAPPEPPDCSWCDGPPPAAIPVPTIAETEVTPSNVISVKLSPTHLQRGQTATLRVSAGAQDDVTAIVQYRDTKPATYKAQIGDSGTLTKTWKVPQYAGVGKAQIKVTVDDPDGPYTTTLSFEVVK
jgi:hypothetical protein